MRSKVMPFQCEGCIADQNQLMQCHNILDTWAWEEIDAERAIYPDAEEPITEAVLDLTAKALKDIRPKHIEAVQGIGCTLSEEQIVANLVTLKGA